MEVVLNRGLLVAIVALGLLHTQVSALKCFVGRGNSSAILPATSDELMKHEHDQHEHGGGGGNINADNSFGIFTCGEPNSELPVIERLAKNVTDQIQAGLAGLIKKTSDVLGGESTGRRRKREDDDSYACVKVVLGDQAYRSCVPKFTNMRMNCTAGASKLALCYCHEDHCNEAGGLKAGMAVLMAAVMAAFAYNY